MESPKRSAAAEETPQQTDSPSGASAAPSAGACCGPAVQASPAVASEAAPAAACCGGAVAAPPREAPAGGCGGGTAVPVAQSVAASGRACCGSTAALPPPGAGLPTRLLAAAGRTDRVLLGLAVLLAGLAVLVPAQAAETARFMGTSLVDIAPYLLASVLLAAYLKAADADRLIARAFAGHPALMVVTASLFGALSPFCSCGVIPLIAALLAMGVPLAPVMAFWLSSPVMAPDMYVLTAGALGTGFATAKTVAAIGVGLLGGYATLALQRNGNFVEPLREGIGTGGCGASSVRSGGPVQWRFWQTPGRLAEFGRASGQTAFFLGKWLALAFALESLMLAWVPAETVASWLGGQAAGAIPLSVAVGVPAYLNGYAAIPLVAGLMHTGMAPGAAMAFMTAGAMTSIPAAVAVYALVKRPVFLWYLSLALIGALLSGLVYQAVASW